jgi:excisionase family DNA binding protein
MTYGIKDVCKRFGVGEHTVLAWIHGGELQAINVSRRLGGKPKWRVTAEALQAFELLRSARPLEPCAKQRRKSATDVVQFY